MEGSAIASSAHLPGKLCLGFALSYAFVARMLYSCAFSQQSYNVKYDVTLGDENLEVEVAKSLISYSR